jgi:hypothetical protein
MTQSDDDFPNAEIDWELRWAPYDTPTYQAVLDRLHPDDIVLEIGAGDLRLARQMAGVARKVYGMEINAGVLRQGLQYCHSMPANLSVIHADALVTEFPPDITISVLLMRHCTHFEVYANKLRSIGCKKLVTNARWGMSVETIDLQAPKKKFEDLKLGWYACGCGAVGFKIGPAELLTPETEAITYEVIDCPECSHH